ncbi:tissue factor pathway inhibitor 2 [Elgaria multicarinata webbii]|uniref:tissue factor pathway inhibitor 2 n=1 Tax=Elgaria multicarinata webbii TaxID=159646 RepID=UPI002FCD5BB1
MERRASGNSWRWLLAASLCTLLERGGAYLWVQPWEDHRDICLKPLIEGDCGDHSHRWHYDRMTQTCKEFIYHGCKGNANNFLSHEACHNMCSKIKILPLVCRLEADTGPCRALLKRYFFNMTEMRCQPFYYGGCYGNENQFFERKSCAKTCTFAGILPTFCYSPKDEGVCSASVTRFYFNADTRKCEKFNYTSCGGNSNNFLDEKSCRKACKGKPSDHRDICLQPLIEGDCGDHIPRWHYNRTTQTCKGFIYHGCKENDNNFLSYRACNNMCSKIKQVPLACRLEPDKGPCRALVKRYFFNMTEMRCQEFVYGGCLGNNNRFLERKSCTKTCLFTGTRPTFCYSPKDEGVCSVSVTRFYYNADTGKCEKFNYTSCGGNSNNFLDEKYCRKACKGLGRETRWKTHFARAQRRALVAPPQVSGRAPASGIAGGWGSLQPKPSVIDARAPPRPALSQQISPPRRLPPPRSSSLGSPSPGDGRWSSFWTIQRRFPAAERAAPLKPGLIRPPCLASSAGTGAAAAASRCALAALPAASLPARSDRPLAAGCAKRGGEAPLFIHAGKTAELDLCPLSDFGAGGSTVAGLSLAVVVSRYCSPAVALFWVWGAGVARIKRCNDPLLGFLGVLGIAIRCRRKERPRGDQLRSVRAVNTSGSDPRGGLQ